jgi:hypothetical protein
MHRENAGEIQQQDGEKDHGANDDVDSLEHATTGAVPARHGLQIRQSSMDLPTQPANTGFT